jgi:GDSL/SGNH-like Acyl-Esterase family found in Pmr5 and Cas1p
MALCNHFLHADRGTILVWILIALGIVMYQETSFRQQANLDAIAQQKNQKSSLNNHSSQPHHKFVLTLDERMEALETGYKRLRDKEEARQKAREERDAKLLAGSSAKGEEGNFDAKNNDDTIGDGESPFCTREQIIDGEWIQDNLDKAPYITSTVHLRCFDYATYSTKPYKTWQWQPNDRKCEFRRYSSSAFCQRMQGGTVSVVGDSLSWEQFSSLVQLNGRHTHQNFQHQSRELHVNIVQRVCENKTAIIYRRDDKLQNVSDSIHEHFPTVLILNRGAHWVPDDQMLLDLRKNVEEVRQWIKKCTEQQLKCHFFWRTSVPGHPGCSNFTQPVNNLSQMEAMVLNLSNYDNHTIGYRWYEYQHQNELVLAELKHSGIPFRVIDGYYLNILRPDDHRVHQGDCLHNCYPGKMDVYNQLLLHYLESDRNDKDTELLLSKQLQVPDDTVFDPVATETAKKIREASRHGQ